MIWWFGPDSHSLRRRTLQSDVRNRESSSRPSWCLAIDHRNRADPGIRRRYHWNVLIEFSGLRTPLALLKCRRGVDAGAPLIGQPSEEGWGPVVPSNPSRLSNRVCVVVEMKADEGRGRSWGIVLGRTRDHDQMINSDRKQSLIGSGLRPAPARNGTCRAPAVGASAPVVGIRVPRPSGCRHLRPKAPCGRRSARRRVPRRRCSMYTLGDSLGCTRYHQRNAARAPTNPNGAEGDVGLNCVTVELPERTTSIGFVAAVGQVVLVEARICIEPADVERHESAGAQAR